MLKISTKKLKLCAYAFLYVNIFIFLFGFLKIYIALPAAAVCGGAIYLNIKNTKESFFTISKTMFITAIVALGLVLIAAGHGGICSQLMDWSARNAILRDLIDRPWPVYYSDGSALSYYIGYFILPGAAGKLIGFNAAYWLMYLYGLYGMVLIYLYLVKLLKADSSKKQVVVLLMLFLFANCESLKVIAMDIWTGLMKYSNPSYSHAGVMIGFTPFYTLYATVFNQIIPAFLVLAMLLSDKDDLGGIAVAAVPLLLYSPFQIIFIFVIALIAMLEFVLKNDLKTAVKRIFTIENIAVLLVLTPLLLLYIWGNITGEKPDVLKFHKLNYSRHWGTYFIFIITQVVLYAAFLFRRFYKNPYFIAAAVGLIILPLYQWGLYNDLCTRTSSVGLFIFMVLIMRQWFEPENAQTIKPKKNKALNIPNADKICGIALAILVGFSAIKPMNEALTAISSGASKFANHNVSANLCDPYVTLEGVEKHNLVDVTYNYFTFDAKNDAFFKALARK